MNPQIPHVYVHVPFCPSICPFCDFHVLTRRGPLVEQFLTGLANEARRQVDRWGQALTEPATIYLGGGTPSHLRDDEMVRLVESLRSTIGWATSEATLEVHPATVTASRLQLWADLGFTRISVGVQSTQDRVLRFLGRSHDAAAALRAIDAAVACGHFTVSADLITAVTGQDVAADVTAVAQRGVDHVSAYTLTIEAGTPFARSGVEVDAAGELRALHTVAELLPRYGIERYEVSNHARPGSEAIHNSGYWHSRYWLGLGPSAASFEPPSPGDGDGTLAVRRTNPVLEAWLASDRDLPRDRDLVDSQEFLRTAMVAGLRLVRDGIDLGKLARRSGIDPLAYFAAEISELCAASLITVVDGVLRASATGVDVLDAVAERFA